MFYEAELQFLRSMLKKCHLQTLIIDPDAHVDKHLYSGLRWLLEGKEHSLQSIKDYLPPMEKNTVYRLSDPFGCEYIFLLLPDTAEEMLFCIGPYLSKGLERDKILEIAEKYKMNSRQTSHLESYYDGIPVLSEDNPVLAALETFGEKIWGGSNSFNVVDITKKHLDTARFELLQSDASKDEATLVNMKIMESRYAYENELIEAVTNGQVHKAELIFSGFSNLTVESRLADPVRNLKNYCVIMNTLLRKAAENGGVHPLHIDSVSSDFALKIERANQLSAVRSLMPEMFTTYCNLVRKHSLKNYSPPVKKVILCVEDDLTANLTLSTLAQKQNLSAGYLSGLFKKETGKTVTEFITEKRIEHAKHLLSTTNLQVQTVAQHCGIYDVHYFSKVFKKNTGLTPKEFKEKS